MKENTVSNCPTLTGSWSIWLFLLLIALLLLLVFKVHWYRCQLEAERIHANQTLSVPQPGSKPPALSSIPHYHQSVVGKDTLAERFKELLQAAAGQDDPYKREDLILHFLAGLDAADFPAALLLLQNAQPPDIAMDLSRRIGRRWAELDPQAVATWASNLPEGSLRQDAMDSVAIVLSNSNLKEAVNWGEQLASDAEHYQVLTVVGNEAVRTDPLTALQIAAQLPPGNGRDELVRRAAMRWVSSDPQNAVTWAEQIPDDTLRANVLAGEATAWASQDPADAATLAVTEVPTGRLLDDTVVSIVERWAQQQPEAAAAWVKQFPEGDMRTAAVENLIVQWSKTDQVGANQWLQEQSGNN